jgi:branched-chain amino acid aminotransferase
MGGNYLNSVLATQECKRNGFDEAILLDLAGNVSEAPGENIFLVRDEQLLTPPISSSALEGITRDTIITLARDIGYKTIIRKIPRSELYLADEIFLTGTAAEITPIIQIDHKKISKVGEITKSMMAAYNDVVMNKNDKYSNWLTAVY